MNLIASSSKKSSGTSSPLVSGVAQAANFFSETSDSSLVESCRAGDLNAFDVLVERHQNRIFNVCYWMLGNRDEAADASQDAFVRAYRSLASFRGDSAFGTWLHRIAVNCAIDATQRRKRAPVLYSDLKPFGEDEREDPEPDASTQPLHDPSLLALREEKRAAVRHALASLPEHYRVVLVLFDIEGYSYEDIGHTLELPLGTVKSRISRARQSLRERLESSRELFED